MSVSTLAARRPAKHYPHDRARGSGGSTAKAFAMARTGAIRSTGRSRSSCAGTSSRARSAVTVSADQPCDAAAKEGDGDVVWPAWPGRFQDEAAATPAPLAEAQEYWRTVGNRLRDAAKWTAVVLGAALATVIGTSPLAGMSEHRPQPIAIFLAAVGLVFLGLTMLLVLQVMRPQSVSFENVQHAKQGTQWLWGRALRKWQMLVEDQQDPYLPCGVRCLTGLRQLMIVEEMTLVALSRTVGKARDQGVAGLARVVVALFQRSCVESVALPGNILASE